MHLRPILPVLFFGLLGGAAPEARELKVCADPNNLPFSNAQQQGFENKLAELVARDLNARLSYVWWPQRRGSIRETLNAGLCDLIPGTGSRMETLQPTKPYYRSTYVAVTRADRGLDIGWFDDPRLRTLRIGVQMVGDDGANTPPAHALARRGIIGNVRGYMIYGDYTHPDPEANIVKAVADGDIDLAFVWGPVAGYFAPSQAVPLTITKLSAPSDGPQLPMAWDVSMGVRKSDQALKTEVEAVLDREQAQIAKLLRDYGVP